MLLPRSAVASFVRSTRARGLSSAAEQVRCVVIGAGVVGLAVARALGGDALILEREKAFGTGTSSRNSEVVHAGLYYPPGTLKARACVVGSRLLYRFCADRGIRVHRCGKLIVAAESRGLLGCSGEGGHSVCTVACTAHHSVRYYRV